jgi:DNA-binding beta-propeller fold protein YncE
MLVAVGGALLLGAAAVALTLTLRGGEEGIGTLPAGSIGAIDPQSHRIVAAIPLAGAPARLAAGKPSVWVANDDSQTISGVDPRTHTPAGLVAIGGFPSDLAVGEGAVWVVDGERGLLVKIDPAYGAVIGKTRVANPNLAYDRSREGFDPTAVAAGLGSVWITDGSPMLTRIDPERPRIVDRIDLGSALNGVALGAGAVWVVSGSSAEAIRLDRRGEVTARIQIASEPGFESPYPLTTEVGEGFVWVLNGNTATVTKIDPEQRAVVATVPIGIDRGPARLAAGAGAAWVANGDGTLARIDAETDDVELIRVGHRLKDVAILGGRIWVTAGTGLSATAAEHPSVRSIRALPTSFCSPIYYSGGGQPQYLIASDLPLQGAGRTGTAQLAEAIEFVLRRHRFRAGNYAIAYQSCNDATVPYGTPTDERCQANAAAYARNRNLIGVIGAFTSGCTAAELPLVNYAVGGPVPMVSPSNTYVGLTRPGMSPGEPGVYYPSGVRNYARVIPADDLQSAADAILAKRLGARRIFVVYVSKDRRGDRRIGDLGLRVSAAGNNRGRGPKVAAGHGGVRDLRLG